MMQKHCWNNFAFNQSYLAEGKINPVVFCLTKAKYKYMILHWQIKTGSDWWFKKILRIRTGSDSIFLDQDWTRTEKFGSPLISATNHFANFAKGHTTVEWTWWRHHQNANRVFDYLSVILAPFGVVFGYFWSKNYHCHCGTIVDNKQLHLNEKVLRVRYMR